MQKSTQQTRARNRKGTRRGKRVAKTTSKNFRDLTDQRFGRLLVIKRSPYNDVRGKPRWLCQCDCGELTTVAGYCLRKKRGGTKSCGCLVVIATRLANTTHGMRNTHTYRCWSAMKDRCHNPRSKDYPRYGNVGITICRRWRKFVNFLKDMGEAPSTAHTIGRRNHAKSYNQKNCRWETPSQQAQNRKTTVYLTIDGQKKPAIVWARQYKLTPARLYQRLAAGWNPEAAVKTPIMLQFSRPKN